MKIELKHATYVLFILNFNSTFPYLYYPMYTYWQRVHFAPLQQTTRSASGPAFSTCWACLPCGDDRRAGRPQRSGQNDGKYTHCTTSIKGIVIAFIILAVSQCIFESQSLSCTCMSNDNEIRHVQTNTN